MLKIKHHHHKHIHRALHLFHHAHHTLLHVGELLVVGSIGFYSLMFASSSISYDYLQRQSESDIQAHFIRATQRGDADTNETKLISIWTMDGKVDNRFAPGYCTYGAARISPEFFPYSGDFNQTRNRWGNAIDRCENAQAAGYAVGKYPMTGSFIVYQNLSRYSYFGHVGKVMYTNIDKKSMIVREMNYLSLYTMDDRRERMDNDKIKCFIYPIIKGGTGYTMLNNFVHQAAIITQPTVTPQATGTQPVTLPTVITTPAQTDTGTHAAAPVITTGITVETGPILPANIEPEITTDILNISPVVNPGLTINLNNLSDISTHFFSKNILTITNTTPQISLGETVKILIQIKDKETGQDYEGILPFFLQSITNNNNLEASMGNMQLMKNGEIEINFTAKQSGQTSIIFTIDDQKIASLPISIN